MGGTAHTLEVTNSCFLDNNLIGAGYILIDAAEVLQANEGNFVSKDDGLNCAFAAVVDEEGNRVSCINSDSRRCLLTGESSSAELRNGSRCVMAMIPFLFAFP
jgi:hypothetical protein